MVVYWLGQNLAGVWRFHVCQETGFPTAQDLTTFLDGCFYGDGSPFQTANIQTITQRTLRRLGQSSLFTLETSPIKLMFLGYPASAVAAYWLTMASTGWEWMLGVGWALAAAACLADGFAALRRVTVEHAARSVALETIGPATGALRF